MGGKIIYLEPSSSLSHCVVDCGSSHTEAFQIALTFPKLTILQSLSDFSPASAKFLFKTAIGRLVVFAVYT